MKFICTVSLILFCLPVWAQEETDSVKTYLEEVVISVNRWEQNLREVSNHVTKINAEQVQVQNPQTSADLLGLSNQVFIQKSQLGGGSPVIRGFATNRVLLVVDGVRMNNAIFRSGNLQNVISIDANSVQETEVIFGPGSVIYGSDAIGGVMDFHTLRQQFSENEKMLFTGNAFSRYSTANNEVTGHTDFNIGLSKWAFTTSVTHGRYGDLRMGANGPDDYTRPDYQVRDGVNDISVQNPDRNKQISTGYNQWNALQKIRFKPNAKWDFTYGLHYSKTSDVPRYDRLILKDNGGVFTSAEWYYGPQKWMMHALQASFLSSAKFFDQAKLTAGYQQHEESRHNRNFTGGNRNRRTDRYEKVNAFSVNFDLDKQLNEKTSLFYGTEFVTNEVNSSAERVDITDGSVSGVSTRYPDGSIWRTYAAYVSLRQKLGEKFLLNASTRYTNVYTFAEFDLTYFDFPFSEATLTNGAINGSVGLIFNPSDKWKIYTNASNGFRAPNVDDIGKVFDSEPGSVVVPNPQLKPETAYNTELGFTGKIAAGFTFDISAYYTFLDNAIARGPSTFNGQSQIDYDGTPSEVLAQQNLSEMVVRGFQAGLLWNITKAMRLSSNLNIQSGEEKDGSTGQTNPPTHIPPTFGSTQFTYKKDKWQVVFYASYNGEISYEKLAPSERADAHLYAKDENGNPYSPSWFTLSLKGTFRVHKNFSIDAGIENILDKRYRPYSSGISAPGRNIFGTLRVRF